MYSVHIIAENIGCNFVQTYQQYARQHYVFAKEIKKIIFCKC